MDVLPTLIELAGSDPRNVVYAGIPDICGNTDFDGQSFVSLFEGVIIPGNMITERKRTGEFITSRRHTLFDASGTKMDGQTSGSWA